MRARNGAASSGSANKPSTQLPFVVFQVGWSFAIRDPKAAESITRTILCDDASIFRGPFKSAAESGG